MSKWKKLIENHKAAQVKLVEDQVVMGRTQSEAARDLGMTRQQLNRFCQINNIKFKGHKNEDVNLVD